MNLLRIGPVKKILAHRWFPLVPQLVMLLVLALLIIGGLGITTEDAAFAKVLRNTNLANLIVWSYWWPLIIVAAIVLGRLWCTVCPVELLSFIAGKYGLRRSVPRFFRSGWAITVFYALVLLVGIHTLAIHRVPHRMALYLLTLVVVSLVINFIYGKRTFCSHVCPVGHLLGLYALISPLEWRADDKTVCRNCKTKDCFVKRNHYRLSGRSCTSNLYPATIKDNRQCLLCTQCLKACPHDNLRLSTRWPFADFFRSLELAWAEVGFILLVSGFVVYEILSEWSVSKSILTWIPSHVAGALGATGLPSGFVAAVVMFVVFPGILFSLVGIATRIVSGLSTKVSLQSLALLLLPTMAAAHILKSILKMTSRIPYFSHALTDPAGVTTARGILQGTIALNTSIPAALAPAVTCLAVALFLAALAAVLLTLARAPALRALSRRAKAVLLVGALLYWGVFVLTIAKWRL